jgi:hypothetical protein
MNFNQLQQLEITGDIDPNDLKLLTNYANQIQSGKIPKVSLEERDKLKSLISKYGPKEEVRPPVKDMKDMTPEEKQVHRDELKKRLREKRMTMTNARQSKFVIEKNMNKSKTNSTPSTNTSSSHNVAPNINSLQNMDLSNLTNMINEIANNNAENRSKPSLSNISPEINKKEDIDEEIEDFLI